MLCVRVHVWLQLVLFLFFYIFIFGMKYYRLSKKLMSVLTFTVFKFSAGAMLQCPTRTRILHFISPISHNIMTTWLIVYAFLPTPLWAVNAWAL